MLAPESLNKDPLLPIIVRLVPAPLTTPEIVKEPAIVTEAVAGITTWQEIVAVPEIFAIAKPPLPTIVNVPPPAEIEEFPSIFVIVLQLPAISIVTVTPAAIVISSVAVGTAAPPQVAGLLQFPLTLAVRAAPKARSPPPSKINTTHAHSIFLRGKKSFMARKVHTERILKNQILFSYYIYISISY